MLAFGVTLLGFIAARIAVERRNDAGKQGNNARESESSIRSDPAIFLLSVCACVLVCV